jgi:GT2 family glycosyltransferase
VNQPAGGPPVLAVVILTWNGRADALACLRSLHDTGHPKAGEAFVVVDNGSNDGTLDAVAERHPWAERIRNDSNLGFAGGNNAGLAWALEGGYRYVMLLNNDTEVPPGAVEALVSHMEEHPEAGAVQPLLVRHGDRGLVDSAGVELFSLPGARDMGIERPVSEAPQEPVRVFGACAAAALYRGSVLREAGLLDEGFFVLLEDVDLDFRIRLAGYDIHLVPSARIFHKRGISSQGTLSGEKKFVLHRNLRALAIRYWPAKYRLLYGPFLAKGWLWGAAYALKHGGGRWMGWAALMKESRHLRRKHSGNPRWAEIQRDWMRPLGLAYYWKKLRERFTGVPALPVEPLTSVRGVGSRSGPELR